MDVKLWLSENEILNHEFHELNELLSMKIMNEWHLKMQRMKRIDYGFKTTDYTDYTD